MEVFPAISVEVTGKFFGVVMPAGLVSIGDPEATGPRQVGGPEVASVQLYEASTVELAG